MNVCVFGAKGNLGSQLSERIVIGGHNLIAVEKDDDETWVRRVMDESDIIHFCIPVESFYRRHTVKPHQIIVLHDSVMATSRQLSRKFFNCRASIIHMSMNKHSTVVVEKDTPNQQSLVQHLKSLGLQVKIMNSNDHDHIMSRSQAPLALLVKLLEKDLEQWHRQHLLTASGDALLETLHDRSSKWTDATMHSLFKNQHISHFIKDMTVLISGK